MAPLIILFFSFLTLWLLNRFVMKDSISVSHMGRIALAIMLVFTGASHFFKTEEMIQMMPEFLSMKKELVYITGLLEMVAAMGLVINKFAKVASIGLMLFFLAVLPANIIGSFRRVELGGMENGPYYLYFRIPLQVLFIAWTYYFGIYLPGKQLKKIISSH